MSSVYPNILVDLKVRSKDDLGFPFLDYGYLYGYGLFESIKVNNGEAVLLTEHIKRIRRGAIILDIPFEYKDEEIQKAVRELIQKNDISIGILNFSIAFKHI